MKRVGKPVFFIVALLVLFFSVTAVFGIHTKNGDLTNTYIKGAGDIRWGIDINGGVEATFTPETNQKATHNELEAAKAVIEKRLNSNNITDYELYTDDNNDRIIVRFPWKNGQVSFDPEAAIQELAATAQLSFREGGQDASSDPETAKIIMTGADVESAEPMVQQDPTTGKQEYVVSLKLKASGVEKFSEATTRLVGQPISIWMDEEFISSPNVNEPITDGSCSISGNFTLEGATKLADTIRAGSLPFKLITTNFSTISPTLGASSLNAMTIAGVIAFILVALFMLIMFRLPGFVAVISLAGQTALCFAAISGYFPVFNSFTMTLPGIAGIILSVGMGVDANIITATRIKEEIWAGRTLDGAIQNGDDNSFWAIFDGNVTTIIVSLILMGVFGPTNILSMIFGASTTGSIYSFGYTLLIGNIGNFIFGVFTTRMMTKSLSSFGCLRKKWLFGGARA